MEGMSVSDIAAVTRDNDFNGGSWIWIVVLFVLLGGGGMWGNNGYGQFATAASQQEILFGQQFQNLDNKIDRLGNGIADATFALNNSVGAVGAAVAEAKYDNAIRLADTNSAIQNCCCTTQRNIDSVNANINEKFAELQKMQLEQTIGAQAARINQLELNAALCGVVRYPNQTTYTAGYSPCFNGAYVGGTAF